jgi:hypothetical protein
MPVPWPVKGLNRPINYSRFEIGPITLLTPKAQNEIEPDFCFAL